MSMVEDIEHTVERMIDHLDRLLLAGEMNQEAYDKTLNDLSEWAALRYTQARIQHHARR